MSTHSHSRRRSPCGTTLILALIALVGLWGCGTNGSPVSPDAEISPPPSGERSYLVFSTRGIQRAAKLAAVPEEGLTVSRVIGPRGGRLAVRDREKRGHRDDLKVELRIPRKALSEKVEISMTVYGNLLSELVAAFEPGGLVFARDAVLLFDLGADRVDIPLSEITAYHVDDSGHAEEARIISIKTYGRDGEDYERIAIRIEVPGFSRYGLQGSL